MGKGTKREWAIIITFILVILVLNQSREEPKPAITPPIEVTNETIIYRGGGGGGNGGPPPIPGPTSLSFELELVPGWNLVSISIIPHNDSIKSIMEGCDYNRIWEYQLDKSWKSTDTGLVSLDMINGYYIDRVGLEDNCTITFTGTSPGITEITISPRWSLVPFPSESSQLLSDVVNETQYTRIWEFQTDFSWKSTDTGLTYFTPGRGYWIDSTEGGSYYVVY